MSTITQVYSRTRTAQLEDTAIIYARIALGVAFLSAVASRFGIWQGTPGMSRFGNFLEYTAEVNSFMPKAMIPFLAWAATVAETTFGFALIAGGLSALFSPRGVAWPRWPAIGSAVLLAMFGTAMAISGGIKSPLDYSVFSASACALLLAVFPDRDS